MKPKTTAAIALIGVLTAPFAIADSPSNIAQRQAAMKSIGEQMKILGDMSRIGGTYDDFFAQAAFETMQAAVLVAQTSFPQLPASTESTRAKPAIWADGPDFTARMTRFLTDVNAAVQEEPATQAEFVPLFAAVSHNCKSCHEHYRAPKN